MNGLSGFIGQRTLASHAWHSLPPEGFVKTRQIFHSLSKLSEKERQDKMPEIGYALVDKDRNIIKKKMMSSHEAAIKNRTTKTMGMEWVKCGF